MGKRKQTEGQSSEPRKMPTRQDKGKEKAEEVQPRKEKAGKGPAISPTPTDDTPIRGFRLKSVGKKKTAAKEVKIIGNPSIQFRDKKHEQKFDKLKNKNISCGRDIDWKSFETSDLYAFLNIICETMKWERLANFDEIEYSEVLVREFYASLPSIGDKSRRIQDDNLKCFMNGMEVTITAKDLGLFLSTEYESEMARKPSEFDVERVWKEFTDSSQTFAQSQASSSFRLAAFKILHAFIDGTILGHQGSHNSVSGDELWIMHQAIQHQKINTAQFILDNIKTVGSNIKFILPYGNILTGYFKHKGLWNDRYKDSMRESARQPIRASTLLGHLFTLQGRQWVKKPPTAGKRAQAQNIDDDESAPGSPVTQSTFELLTQIERSIQDLRTEVNERLDLQDAKLEALDVVMKKVERQMSEMYTYGKTAEEKSEQNKADTSSSTQQLSSEEARNTKAAQDGETSKMKSGKQTLQHLSEAASTFETQGNQPPFSTQTSPKPPADDMLFLFPSK